MAAFDLENFTRRLIAETLFYDDEFGAIGNLSLVDLSAKRERFLANYVPDEGNFIIEEATEWEDAPQDDGDDIGYALAVDGSEHGSFDSAEEAADALLELAREHNLAPSVTLLFEDEEIG